MCPNCNDTGLVDGPDPRTESYCDLCIKSGRLIEMSDGSYEYKCTFDPEPLKGLPLGMFHCPECGDMVIAGMPHGMSINSKEFDDSYAKYCEENE